MLCSQTMVVQRSQVKYHTNEIKAKTFTAIDNRRFWSIEILGLLQMQITNNTSTMRPLIKIFLLLTEVDLNKTQISKRISSIHMVK